MELSPASNDAADAWMEDAHDHDRVHDGAEPIDSEEDTGESAVDFAAHIPANSEPEVENIEDELSGVMVEDEHLAAHVDHLEQPSPVASADSMPGVAHNDTDFAANVPPADFDTGAEDVSHASDAELEPAVVPEADIAATLEVDVAAMPEQANKTATGDLGHAELPSLKPTTAGEDDQKFLLQYASSPNVVQMPSGLLYSVVTSGKGGRPTIVSPCKCHYEGRLASNHPAGPTFDSSYKRGEPATFAPNQVLRVGGRLTGYS